MVEIRIFDRADTEAVVALWREVFAKAPAWNHPESDIARKLSVQPELFFVASEDDEIVGTAMAGFDGHRGWVYYVAVRKSHRRRGVGGKLMRHVEKKLAQSGCTKLNLQIRSWNRDVQAFYESLGYDVEDHVSMGKLLTD